MTERGAAEAVVDFGKGREAGLGREAGGGTEEVARHAGPLPWPG